MAHTVEPGPRVSTSTRLPKVVCLSADGSEDTQTAHPNQDACGFDYATMAAPTADALRKQAARIRDRLTAAVIETGRDLAAVKQHLPHGAFARWVESECGFTARTAQRYMRAAEVFGDKPDTVSHLPERIVYAISAPSTPEPVRAEIVHLLDGGKITVAEIEERIAHGRARAKMERAEAKLSAKTRKAKARRAETYERDREDRKRSWQEAEAAARIAASKLIAKHGIEAVRDVLTADWEVQAALHTMVNEATEEAAA